MHNHAAVAIQDAEISVVRFFAVHCGCCCTPHESAPAYLIDELCQVADVEARQRLRSSSSSSLIVSRTRLSAVRDRAFPVAAARVWNSLPELVTSAPSVAVFRSRLKTHLFTFSYPSPL